MTRQHEINAEHAGRLVALALAVESLMTPKAAAILNNPGISQTAPTYAPGFVGEEDMRSYLEGFRDILRFLTANNS